jgi:hypothetical protein
MDTPVRAQFMGDAMSIEPRSQSQWQGGRISVRSADKTPIVPSTDAALLALSSMREL